MNKKEIRAEIRRKRESLTEDYINKASQEIFKKLISELDFLTSPNIMSYMDFKNEVKTDNLNKAILKVQKTLLLPKVIDKEIMIPIENNGKFEMSPFGNPEPIGVEYKGDIDLIITPGVAFDKFGNRVGFGRGYYDRFFDKYPNAKRIAIAFDIQVIDGEIETDCFDKKIDMLITETNIYKF